MLVVLAVFVLVLWWQNGGTGGAGGWAESAAIVAACGQAARKAHGSQECRCYGHQSYRGQVVAHMHFCGGASSNCRWHVVVDASLLVLQGSTWHASLCGIIWF